MVRSAVELASRMSLPGVPQLFQRALTHGSANETGGSLPTNETLAFLGDAVLELAIRRRGWTHDESVTLGSLSIKADEVARNSAIAKLARAARLDEYVVAGGSDGAKQDSVFASAFEATLGAIFLEYGFEEADRVACMLLDGALPPA